MMHSIGALSGPWPCGLSLAQRHKRPGQLTWCRARSGWPPRPEPLQQETRRGGAWWRGEHQRGKIYLLGKGGGGRVGDHRRALAMARQWRMAMFDDSGWQTVVRGDARMVLQHRGAQRGEAQRKSMRNGRRAMLTKEGWRHWCFIQDLARAAVPRRLVVDGESREWWRRRWLKFWWKKMCGGRKATTATKCPFF
jgi:hypothetical protein